MNPISGAFMIKPALLFGFAAAIAFTAHADNGENDVRKAVEAGLGKNVKVDSVRDTGVLGLYEVSAGGDLLYTDRKAGFLFVGEIIDLKTKKNLTEERKNKLAQIKFSDLPIDIAIKQVKGNGKRVLATFEDPNCGYCKKLAKELQGMTDVTIYTFLYPVLSPDSEVKSKSIWCAADKVKAWNDWMVNGTAPAAAAANCDTSAIDKISTLGRKLNIRGTPTLFFIDGNRVPGYMPVAQLEQALSKGGATN
jgi:thiol:disulfide interchange protein DsbC